MKLKLLQHRDKGPAQKAASSGGRFLGRLFGRKKEREPQTISAGALVTTPSANSNFQTKNGLSSDGSSLASPSDQSLWDRAYEALEEQNPDLTRKYRELLVVDGQQSLGQYRPYRFYLLQSRAEVCARIK